MPTMFPLQPFSCLLCKTKLIKSLQSCTSQVNFTAEYVLYHLQCWCWQYWNLHCNRYSLEWSWWEKWNWCLLLCPLSSWKSDAYGANSGKPFIKSDHIAMGFNEILVQDFYKPWFFISGSIQLHSSGNFGIYILGILEIIVESGTVFITYIFMTHDKLSDTSQCSIVIAGYGDESDLCHCMFIFLRSTTISLGCNPQLNISFDQ